MSFLKRLFSADYRAAVSAEAAGDLELAAERYALAGQHDAAVKMHLARAERASSRGEEIAALRDALHWCGEPEEDDEIGQEQRRQVSRALGLALFGRARAEGIATERDRERVREAARLLEEGREMRAAGEAWETIDDDARAIEAYSRGGFVARMEAVLARDEERTERHRRLKQTFADYQMHLRGGDRDRARDKLRTCIEVADNKSEYRRLLDELESSLITGGRAALRIRLGDPIAVCSAPRLLIGRDPLCDLSLRSGGVSRQHAAILCDRDGYRVRDAGSRNGTLIGGMPITAEVPLSGSGTFALGDDVEIDYEVTDSPVRLSLEITSGLDRGARLLAAPPGEPIDLTVVGLPVQITFEDGRPLLTPKRAEIRIRLDDEPVVGGKIQLVHGDHVNIDGVEMDVL